MINIRPLTDAMVDALMDANQIEYLAQLIEDTSANKAYEIGKKLTGNLSRKRKGLILLLEDDLRAWLLRQGLGRRGRRNIKRTLGKYD